METKEFQTYELVPPLRGGLVYVIFDDRQSAEIFDIVREKFDDIRREAFIPVFLTNLRWAEVRKDYAIYPEEFRDGLKIIIPNPRRHEGQSRQQDNVTWNRYLEYRNVWNIAYLGYFTEFGCSNSYKPKEMEHYFDPLKAKQFELEAWKSYKRESEIFKSLNGFNWAYLEKFSPGIIEKIVFEHCFDLYAGFTSDYWSC